MDKDRYNELLSVLMDRYVRGEIDKNTYAEMKKDIDNEFNDSTGSAYISGFSPGDMVSNRYRIMEKLGQGGMATVYLAENISLGKKVAIKKILPSLMTDRGFIERFTREAQSQAKLSHPGIAQVLDFDPASHSLIIEYIEGDTLDKRLSEGNISERLSLHIIKQVLNALNYAHQKGIIHRDIKPSNIMIDSNNNAKITDFGIALIMGQERHTKTGVGIGTPEYMSPEQIKGDKIIDHRTDVYSCGIVLYEMLTGQLPFKADGSTQNSDFAVKNMHISKSPDPLNIINPDIDKALSDIILKSLSKSPDDRYSGCGEFCSVIENYIISGRISRKPEEEAVRTEQNREKIESNISLGISPGTRKVISIKGIETAFRYIPPGRFIMGSPPGENGRYDNEIQHEVIISKGFWMMETTVTQQLYKAVIGKNPSYFRDGFFKKRTRPYHPVENISWHDAVDFCNNLSRLTGDKYTLPTEAEWEYACRAGSTTAYSFGSSSSSLGSYAWYYDNSGRKTQPVGQKKPNSWGLYDMHGNVWEWCLDWYGNYSSGSVTDPKGPSSVSGRVLRGGGWLNRPRNLRSADRYFYNPDLRNLNGGFRAVLR